MTVKKLTPAKKLLLASASTLALVPNLAIAQGGKGDEGPPPDPAPQLKLNQVAFPVDAFIPAFNDPDAAPTGSMFEDEYDLYDNSGVLFVGEMPDDGIRMDFIVSHIRNDKAVNVFLVMGTELAPDPEGDLFPGVDYSEWLRDGHDRGEWDGWEQELDDLWEEIDEKEGRGAPPEEIQPLKDKAHKVERKFLGKPPPKAGGKGQVGWKPRPGKGNPPPPVHAGEICIDIDDSKMDIIAGVQIQPSVPIPQPPFELGHGINSNFTSTVISVKLSKEKLREFGGQEIFFQAAALPADTNAFPDTQVSECDRYLIENIIDADPSTGEEGDPGTKGATESTTSDPGSTEPTLPVDEECGDKGVC